ncbi:MAG TPA: hypothetical protein VET48_04355, partial [Steroidobacteraceae bacterium]|nr:hypothetical protein [Steroidobacteraceae bacterium]
MAAPKRYDLKDFFRTPDESGYHISPDGNWISYLAPYERRKNIFVMPRTGGEARRVTSETARDMAGYFWKDSNRIIYAKDFAGDENFHLLSVGVDGSDLKDLTPFDGVTVRIIDDLEEHPAEMIISMNKR